MNRTLDLRRHPAGLHSRHGRDALPWLVAGALPALLLLSLGVQALPDAAHWQSRLHAHEAQRRQLQGAQAQARAEQARQAGAALHLQQWQAWQAHQDWLAQLWLGLSQAPSGVHLQQLQVDETRVQLQLSAAHEETLSAVLQGLQVAGTGPWQLRQQTFVEATAAPAWPSSGAGLGPSPGRWLFVLQADVPGQDGRPAHEPPSPARTGTLRGGVSAPASDLVPAPALSAAGRSADAQGSP